MKWFPSILVLLCCCWMACNTTSKEVTLSKVNASSSKKKGKEQTTLVATANMRQKSAYENIKGNIPRLKAMMCGRFTVYSTSADPNNTTYSTWLVNDGQDSVLVYTVPVGEAALHGHWLYQSQFMTSLPDVPIHEAFIELKAINRDSIVATYYEVPEDFGRTLDDILRDPKEQFKEFQFENLALSKDGEVVWYERLTPLKFHGRSNWAPTEEPIDIEPASKAVREGVSRYYYIITPGNFHYGTEYYDKNRNFIEKDRGYRLLKSQMLSNAYNGR